MSNPVPSSKLTVFTSFSGEGGVERMIMNLVREFARQGIQVDLLALRANSAHLDNLPENIRFIPLQAKHTSTAVSELARYLRREQPKAMLVAKDRPGRAALLARKRAGVDCRIVIRLGTNLAAALKHRSRLQSWLRRFPMRRRYQLVDHVVAVSAGVAEDTQQITGLPENKITVIRNPVVTPSLLQKADEAVDHPWLNHRDLPVLLAAGRLTVQKDFETLIQAFAKVQPQQPARLIILGDGKLRPQLDALVQSLGLQDVVDLPGFQTNPWAWMKQADLFVLSSRWEGSPNVLTEAIALGTPVVATDCPSGPRELLQNGEFGHLVPVGDDDALATAILDTLQSPLSATTLQQAAQAYTAEISAAHYLDVLFPHSSAS